MTDADSYDNILATQVWPSARECASVLVKNIQSKWNVAEVGCGPGYPALTAAAMGCRTYATDISPFALELVEAAANIQNFNTLQTRYFDVTNTKDYHWLDEMDLVLISDIFESNAIAKATAEFVYQLLSQGKQQTRIWIFAQQDRAQREVFRQEIRLLTNDPSLDWERPESGIMPTETRIFLYDVDECLVKYR